MKEQNRAGLDKAKMVTADILGQATAMGVHLNDQDAEARDNLMREVLTATDEDLTPGDSIDIDALPEEDDDATAPERVVKDAIQEAEAKFFEPDVPDDVKEELDTPDFEEMAERELENNPPQPAQFQDESWQLEPSEPEWDELDQDLIEERKKRIAAEKKAAYYENMRIQSDQKRWASEAKTYFPLSESAIKAGQIQAKSRKDYLRKAKAAHEMVLPYVKSAIERRDKTLAQERAKVARETREEFIRAWGRPSTGPSSYPSQADDLSEDLAQARKKGDLARSIGILRKRAEQQGREE